MSFEIKYGLFKLNITDHHAVLGVSLDADQKKIRLQYLKIAQKLHPDKCRKDPAKMKAAGEILSKLVNPAYEQLSRKTAYTEHQIVLTQIGKRLAENRNKVTVKNPLAQELLKAGIASADLVYQKLLKKLTAEQYQSLDRATENIEAISELNMVYLMLQGDRKINRPSKNPASTTATTTNESSQASQAKAEATATAANTTAKPEEPTTESRINAFVTRAQQYISKKEYDRAIKELKDALRIDPNHGAAHAVMGKAYLHRQQLTMAKVHISKAYKAEPHNPIVIDSKKALDKLSKVATKSKTTQPDSQKSSKNDKPANSGFFSGFFGAKKK